MEVEGEFQCNFGYVELGRWQSCWEVIVELLDKNVPRPKKKRITVSQMNKPSPFSPIIGAAADKPEKEAMMAMVTMNILVLPYLSANCPKIT